MYLLMLNNIILLIFYFKDFAVFCLKTKYKFEAKRLYLLCYQSINEGNYDNFKNYKDEFNKTIQEASF
ncbi:hypothetical protein BpHYR1_027144 [Brachionus plicatilis]|uniref:Uncharacterized protein n=1 Tax=Brachionus plicatilis TaxID=10195 RepID=A0A3M7QFM5_BRAPC|nr:hypothetical protein BpHYR1_027144 [Brachionus plicatilis]